MVFSQNVNIKTTIDTAQIIIGDPIQLTLKATFDPQNFIIHLPHIDDTFNHFEVVEIQKTDTTQAGNLSTIIQKITITNFDSGAWYIPVLEYKISPLNGTNPYIMHSDSIRVQVQTIAADTSKPFKPIFGIREVNRPIAQIIQYILIGLIALATILFLIYYLRKKAKQKGPKPKPLEPTLLPHEKALKQINHLKAENAWQNQNQKQYFTDLTDVVRTYLEEQFQIDSFEKTSAEIISQVKKVKALSTSRQALRNLLELADVVKFAKGKPTEDECLQTLEQSIQIIIESYKKVKPIEEP
ncbi:MAG: hypothetical protein IT215_00660 [Chitinophagaceae bacterium]|nr:hypothetical protein [Chitinophagaceae bacterium]HMN33082.1 hypothetical protein [Chitinophagaceae bacterium]